MTAVIAPVIAPLLALGAFGVLLISGLILWALPRQPNPWSEEAYEPVRQANLAYTEAMIAHWSACKAEADARAGANGS